MVEVGARRIFDAWSPWTKAGYIAHELSHGWWSSADFKGEDYWLVESTAEYTALRFVEHELGPAPIAPILGHGRPAMRPSAPVRGEATRLTRA